MFNRKWIFTVIIIMCVMLVGCATTKQDWERAQTLNNIEAYEDFLRKHPQNEFSNDAKHRIERMEWNKAQSLSTIQAYRNFISKYPTSTFNEVARKKLKVLINSYITNVRDIKINIEELSVVPVRHGDGSVWTGPEKTSQKEREKYIEVIKNLITQHFEVSGYNVTQNGPSEVIILYTERLASIGWHGGLVDRAYKEYSLKLILNSREGTILTEKNYRGKGEVSNDNPFPLGTIRQSISINIDDFIEVIRRVKTTK